MPESWCEDVDEACEELPSV